jgi:hypothetical protein
VQAESVSAVARLQEIRTHVFDNTLHVQFFYTTGDASGQNMTSACTWMACRWIKEQVAHNKLIGLQSYMIEGNMSGDKKVNHQNFTLGRGVAVTATCRIPGAILKKRLRITPDEYYQKFQASEVGAQQSGMLGVNINFANIVAGVFAATGQDLACVHESACGYLKIRLDKDTLVVSVYLPSLVVGTVGGGTKLPTQKECLQIMGCYGNGRVFRMAEIIAATCLALDLSTGAAIATNEFVHAHEHFGRNRPKHYFSPSMINTHFFNKLMANELEMVRSFTPQDMDTSNAILSRITGEEKRTLNGLFRYRIELCTEQSVRYLDTVLKIKPPTNELLEVGVRVARLTGEDTLSGLFESQAHIFNLEDANIREIALYRNASQQLRPYLPIIYGLNAEELHGFYAILMEDLTPCSHLNTIDTPQVWEHHQIEAVLSAMADIHSTHWNRHENITKPLHLERVDPKTYQTSNDLLRGLTDFNTSRYPHLIDSNLLHIMEKTLEDLDGLTHAMLQQPQVLIHNDFNPRNICLRINAGVIQPVIYDWELAMLGNPQHDLIEFLINVLDLNVPLSRFDEYVEFYRRILETKIQTPLPAAEFQQGLILNALDLILVRFNLYLMGHNLLHLSFLERVYRNLKRYIHHIM